MLKLFSISLSLRQEFVDPVKPIDHTSRLEAELERQRQELNKREAELKTQLADNSDKYQQQTSEQ
jgi:hypothetical protein